MKLENLRLQRNIENNDKQSNKRYQINIIDDRESDEIYQIGENMEEKLNRDIEVLKLRKLISQKKMDYLDRESDEINHMDLSDDKENYKTDQIRKNDE